MYNFASDYLEGAHPQVMEALNKTNFIQTVGYGEDQYCQKAKDKIKAILENENVDIHFSRWYTDKYDYDFFSIKRLSSCYCC